MLSEPEKNTLKDVLSRVRTENMKDVVKILNEILKQRQEPYSVRIVKKR